jgi:hypothetical protein
MMNRYEIRNRKGEAAASKAFALFDFYSGLLIRGCYGESLLGYHSPP